jgi:hypothetical protein
MGTQYVRGGIVVSGITVTGTIGQTCLLTAFNGGGSGAAAIIYLTANLTAVALTANSPYYLTAYGTGYTSAPTAATVSSGTAACSGTPVLSSILATAVVTATATYLTSHTVTLSVAATTSVVAGTASIGTDDTAAIAAAIQATVTGKKECFFPAGTYFTDTITGINNIGNTITGAGSSSSILKSAYGNTVIEITAASIHDLTISRLGVDGNGGQSNHGIYFHDNNFVWGVLLEEINAANVGGNAIKVYQMFASKLYNIQGSSNGADIFWLYCGPSMSLSGMYAHSSGVGYAGYRLLSGRFSCIACNGIDNGTNISNDWGVLGATVAEDGFLGYGNLDLDSSNVEGFWRYGIRLKVGQVNITNVTFLADQPGATPEAFRMESTDVTVMPFSNVTMITASGDTWDGSYAIHGAQSCPYIVWYTPTAQVQLQCWNESIPAAQYLTYVTGTSAAYKVGVAEWSKLGVLDAYLAHIDGIGTAPTINTGFGTSPTIAGFDSVGRVTVGSGGTAKSGVVYWGTAYTRTYVSCYVQDETTPALNATMSWIATLSHITISNTTAFNASDVISWICMGY